MGISNDTSLGNLKSRGDCHFDTGMDDGTISPFRVPGIYPEIAQEPCAVPPLDSLDQYDFKMHLQLTPKESQKRRILKIVYPKKDSAILQPAIHFPKIIAHIRQEAIHKVGPDVDKPTLRASNRQEIALSKAN